MQHLPLFADLKNRAVVVVGGGIVAERRVNLLLDAGAAVTVVAPTLTERLTELETEGRFTHVARTYNGDSLEPFWLVIAATDDRAVNAAVAAAALAAKRFCNVVDDLELCTFIMPAIVDRSPVTIAI
ncbi:MAG TPA: bifunctional precorrin-2 dehydrogenase/sirohydrochlorin ferrochelatase, partial [Gammaproteobacteria bacterium]|nr:bifunctional precorrin-2 dehydrogenase/sirohydrochlorin ferrochelatase [Gammaproteobacteria bacterium]